MKHLEMHCITRGRVNFSNQSINRDLALSSSRTKEYATIDLKDASDLVSNSLVEALFPERVNRYLQGTRTRATKLPDGRVIELRKFAPMGSCLCFPIEAFVFFSISVASLMIYHQLSRADACRAVYVYGDDIIVKTQYVYTVISALEAVGLKVNRDKSYIFSNFRESCGMDAFRGVDVTIARFRKIWSTSGWSGDMVASYVALSNILYEKGYVNGANRIRAAISTRWRIPVGTNRSSGLCYHFERSGCPVTSAFEAASQNVADGFRVTWCQKRHLPCVRSYLMKDKKVQTPLDGWKRLLRNLILGEQFTPDHDTVRGAVKLVKGTMYF